MPPFAIGKFWWDNCIVGSAFKKNIMSIDVTESVFVIHQNTPWFLGGKVIHVSQNIRDGPEAKRNIALQSFGRKINDGTNYQSFVNAEGKITFRKK